MQLNASLAPSVSIQFEITAIIVIKVNKKAPERPHGFFRVHFKYISRIVPVFPLLTLNESMSAGYWCWEMFDRQKCIKLHFQLGLLPEDLTIINLRRTASRILISADPKFRLCCTNFHSSDNDCTFALSSRYISSRENVINPLVFGIHWKITRKTNLHVKATNLFKHGCDRLGLA